MYKANIALYRVRPRLWIQDKWHFSEKRGRGRTNKTVWAVEMGWALTVPSARAEMTFPRAERDLLIFLASSSTDPSAPVLLTCERERTTERESGDIISFSNLFCRFIMTLSGFLNYNSKKHNYWSYIVGHKRLG